MYIEPKFKIYILFWKIIQSIELNWLGWKEVNSLWQLLRDLHLSIDKSYFLTPPSNSSKLRYCIASGLEVNSSRREEERKRNVIERERNVSPLTFFGKRLPLLRPRVYSTREVKVCYISLLWISVCAFRHPSFIAPSTAV